jgi:hypothetical protein
MTFDDPAHDGEAEPGAGFAACASNPGTAERFEELREILLGNALPLVRDRDRDVPILTAQDDRDFRIHMRELNRIAQQIIQHLFDFAAIER